MPKARNNRTIRIPAAMITAAMSKHESSYRLNRAESGQLRAAAACAGHRGRFPAGDIHGFSEESPILGSPILGHTHIS